MPLFLRLDGVQPDWDRNTILLACERHAPGKVSSVTLHREERAAFVRFKTTRGEYETTPIQGSDNLSG